MKKSPPSTGRPAAPYSSEPETAVAVVAGAIGNAVFDVTGARLQEVLFTPERVRDALDTRG